MTMKAFNLVTEDQCLYKPQIVERSEFEVFGNSIVAIDYDYRNRPSQLNLKEGLSFLYHQGEAGANP
jgi:hypothetical protein